MRNPAQNLGVLLQGSAPVTLGVITGVEDGKLLVDYCGNTSGPVVAVSTLELSETEATELVEARTNVVLAFLDGRQDTPVILGLVHKRFSAHREQRSSEGLSAHVDGEHLLLEGKKSVELRCGKASITLTRQGKIVLRGAHISSISSGANRIRGGSVEIN